MKLLIAYAGKTGTTAKAAAALRDELNARGAQTECCDLTAASPALNGFDAVAVGGSIRMGRLHAKAARFLKTHQAELMALPLGVFCCRCGTDDTNDMLAKQLDPKLLAHAGKVVPFGGEMDLAKQKGFDRWAVKMLLKSGPSAGMKADGLRRESIATFADALLQACPHG